MITTPATSAARYAASMARVLGCIAAGSVIMAVAFGSLAPLCGLASAALVLVLLSVICVWRITGQWHGSAGAVMLGYRRVYVENPLRRITGRRAPDHIAIAAMEREVYGETFRHEGGIASVFLPPELHPLVTPKVPPGLFGSIAELRRERRTHPDTAEPATLEQYLAWLNGYIKRGGKPTHFYDYPFGRPGFCYAASSPLVVDSDREYGANSREIIVAKGVEVQRTNPAASFGGWGHSSLYFMDGYRAGGPGFVPVYSDPEFDFARRDDDDHRPNLRWERPSDPPTG